MGGNNSAIEIRAATGYFSAAEFRTVAMEGDVKLFTKWKWFSEKSLSFQPDGFEYSNEVHPDNVEMNLLTYKGKKINMNYKNTLKIGTTVSSCIKTFNNP